MLRQPRWAFQFESKCYQMYANLGSSLTTHNTSSMHTISELGCTDDVLAAQHGLFHAILEMNRLLQDRGGVELGKQFLREMQPSLSEAIAITGVEEVMQEETEVE